MDEGVFVAWHKNEGDLVQAGEPLFSLETDKAVQEVESLDSGRLRIAPRAPKPGETVGVGTVIGSLHRPDEFESAPDRSLCRHGSPQLTPRPAQGPGAGNRIVAVIEQVVREWGSLDIVVITRGSTASCTGCRSTSIPARSGTAFSPLT